MTRSPFLRASNPTIVLLAVAVLFIQAVATLAYLRLLWTAGPDGLSLMSRRLPYWDFTNLWAGSRMALDGHMALLFDADAYRAALRALFSLGLPDQEWSYPPSMALIGAPLAMLPILPAYLLWTAGTVFCLWLAIRPLNLGRLAELAIVTSPAVVMNVIFGQNGALVSALLIGGLWAAPSRPVLAGLLFGLLTIKPHLGLLVPFCLLASGNWRTIGAAAASAAILTVTTGLAFGFDVWLQFWSHTRPLMVAIMEAPFPQPYHSNAMTVFFGARMLGLELGTAYPLQGCVTVCAIAAAIWLWRPSRLIEHQERVIVSALLAIVATPYGYTYDSIALAIAVVFLLQTGSRLAAPVWAAIWLLPMFAHLPNVAGIPLGGAVLLAVAIHMIARIVRRERTWRPLRSPSLTTS